MRVTLIYPFKKRCIQGCNPPISILYLAASLQKAGYNVAVIDRDEDNISDLDILKRLNDYQPTLIGIPLFSNHMRTAYDLVNLLSSHNADWKIVIGGPHATARPEQVLEIFKGCNYVLRGESEDSIVDLARCIENNSSLDAVRGLSYKQNGSIFHNPDAVVNMDLDSIQFPNRKLIDTAYKKKTYFRIGHRGTTDVIITSRGCPFNCNFCFKITKIFRARSPENVLEELMLIRSQGIRNVHIMDDLFVVPKSRCLTILKMIKEQKLDMEFKVRSRVDLINEELLVAMKEAGVKAVVYGFESGSQKILDLMNKQTTVEMNYKVIALTKKVGLQCYADIFIGYPGETIETINETQKFILKAKPTAVNFAVMYPLPNTKVYDLAKEQGTLINDWSVNGPQPWIKLPWIENKDILFTYRRKMLRKYLTSPVVIANVIRFTLFKIDFRQLKMIIRYFFRL